MMNNNILFSVVVGIVINLALPQILLPFATPDEIKPPNGADDLSIKEQLMHMFVHHAQVPLPSTIIVAIIILLSMMISNYIIENLM